MATSEITLKLDAKGNATQQLGALDTKLGGIDTKMLAITAGAAAIGAAVGKFVSEGIAAYSDFENKLAEIEARTQLTDEEMDAVAETAKRMGIETAFSATDAAGAMLQLISSGSDAVEAIALIPDLLDLAAASGLDLETTADALTDVMKQFGLSAEDATRVVDTLAAASQSSSATVMDMIQAMANGGVVAASFGISLEDTAAALAVIAENGVKGSEAGTQFKSMLLSANRNVDASQGALNQLGIALYGAQQGITDYTEAARAANAAGFEPGDLAVSFFDEEGKARDLATVMNDINRGMDLFTDEQRVVIMKDLFGSFGQIAAGAILNADGIDSMVDSMAGQNSAAEVAEARLESYDQKVNLLNSSLEGLFIEVIGPLVEQGLKPLVEWVTNALNAFTLWVGEGDKARVAMNIVMTVLGFLGSQVQDVFGFINAVLTGDWAQAWAFAQSLVTRGVAFIEGILLTGIGLWLTLFADFYAGLVGGALEGLDLVVKLFQTAVNWVEVAFDNMGLAVLTTLQNLVNGALGLIEEFIHGVADLLEPVAYTFIDPGGLIGRTMDALRSVNFDDVNFIGDRVVRSTAGFQAPGLGLGDNVREQISQGIRQTGQGFIERGGAAFERAQNVQVTNVNVEIGTHVGDDDDLIRTIGQAMDRGRLTAF